jgi:parallel beta-helix repeat protein
VNGINLNELPSNNNITNNRVYLNSWAGIRLDSSSNNNITDNYVYSNNKFGIILSDHSNYNNITNNNVSSNKDYGIFLFYSSTNNITNNNVSSSNESGIYLWDQSNNNTISNNNVSNNTYGIYLRKSSNNNIIAKNNVSSNTTYIGIYLDSASNNNTITSNNLSKNGYGIELYSSLNNNITNNNVSYNGNGIFLTGTSLNNNIAYNYVSNNSGGISLVGSTSNNVVTNNIVSSNLLNDILVFSSYDNTIINNNISNSYNGILLTSSSHNNIITNNTIFLNKYGIRLSDSSNNRVYHNNIIDNIKQALDNMNDNIWNDAYPSGGNYWSDYSPICQDLFNGAMTPQTTGSPDEICDVQYNIDADSKDFYPLTNPFGFLLPAPPTNLSAELTGNNLENVTISWDASLDDPINVTNYAVFYSTNYDFRGINYEFLTEFPALGASKYYFTIISVGEGDPSNYFFYVQANTTVIYNFIKSDTQVAKFTESLTSGKHLVSIPLILNNTNISNALQTLKFNTAWYYNNTNLLDPWKSYNPSKPINDLSDINHTIALWIDVAESSNLTVAGIVPKTTSIELKSGWNFVGYPSLIERTVADALSGINYERIEGYSQSPPEYLRIYTDIDLMIAGYGYWIKVSADVTWTLEN